MRFSRTAWVPALLLAALVISLGTVDSAWAALAWIFFKDKRQQGACQEIFFAMQNFYI